MKIFKSLNEALDKAYVWQGDEDSYSLPDNALYQGIEFSDLSFSSTGMGNGKKTFHNCVFRNCSWAKADVSKVSFSNCIFIGCSKDLGSMEAQGYGLMGWETPIGTAKFRNCVWK